MDLLPRLGWLRFFGAGSVRSRGQPEPCSRGVILVDFFVCFLPWCPRARRQWCPRRLLAITRPSSMNDRPPTPTWGAALSLSLLRSDIHPKVSFTSWLSFLSCFSFFLVFHLLLNAYHPSYVCLAELNCDLSGSATTRRNVHFCGRADHPQVLLLRNFSAECKGVRVKAQRKTEVST